MIKKCDELRENCGGMVHVLSKICILEFQQNFPWIKKWSNINLKLVEDFPMAILL